MRKWFNYIYSITGNIRMKETKFDRNPKFKEIM